MASLSYSATQHSGSSLSCRRFDFVYSALSSDLKEALTNSECIGGDSTSGSLHSSSVMEEETDIVELGKVYKTAITSPPILSMIEDDNPVTFLCELIGARDLKILDDDITVDPLLLGSSGGSMDVASLRPYCVVRYNDRKIHCSREATDAGNNPIWVPSTKSLFLLSTSATEMSNGHLHVSIYSKNTNALLPVNLLQSGPKTFLGQVTIEASTILSHCDEERFEVNLKDEVGEETSHLGKLAMRFRMASPSDTNVVRFFNQASNFVMEESERELVDMILESANSFPSGQNPMQTIFPRTALRPTAPLVSETDEAEIAQSGFFNAVSNVFSSRTKRDSETGVRKVRVKPRPDPDRKVETEFLKPHDLKLETRLPSKKWIEAGSGTLGKLFVEILSCHGLPNMDSGGQLGNFTDSFCCVVFEDSCAMTDVIDDELSPHWLPWTQRAFVFNMIHLASILYLAVFDFDIGIGQHDAVGRVAVNVSNLQHDTVHTLKYNLYPSSNVTDRIAAGSITIRVRIECFDERAALLAAWKPRPNIHVNVTKEKSFRVVRYTCFGEYDNEEKFDLTVTRSYVNELFEYKAAVTYAISDAFKSLMFWRGQVEIFSVLIPIHSLVFYVMATRLVETPQLIVPYSLLGIGWAMLANLSLRRHHPSPWERCPSFLEYLHILWTGQSSIPIKSVKEYEGADAAKSYEEARKKRLEQDRMLATRKAELLQEINDIGDDNIHTKVSQGPIPLDLLMRLARYQVIVGRLCKKFRLAKIILTWEESVVSFWVTASFLCAGIVTLILPWGFILTWFGRIFVYGCFGPHMKLVDLYLRANEKENKALKELTSNFHIQSSIARRRRENALKIKDLKELAFGRYSIQVPSFNLSRHFDRPLPESSSRVCRKGSKQHKHSDQCAFDGTIEWKTPWIPGQHLYGSMIPRPQEDENVHKEEALRNERILRLFQDRVREIKDAQGLSEYERIQLLKLGVRASLIPMSFGYEVTPMLSPYDVDSTARSRGSSSRSMRSLGSEPQYGNLRHRDASLRVAVKLMSDKQLFVDDRESKGVILESDGKTTYCISEEDTDEEGLEVVGLGRYNTVIDEAVERFEEELLESKSNDTINVDDRLSRALSSNEKVQVAYYKPLQLDASDECTKSKME